MKSFLKTFFASLLGTITGLGCLSVILFVVVAGMITASISGFLEDSESTKITQLEDHTILKIDLTELKEIVTTDPWSGLFNRENTQTPLSLSNVVETIQKAKNDPHISGIYLAISDINAGLASVEVLRRSLEDFKASGKFIIAYSDTYSQKDYYLSSIADEVLLNPNGTVNLVGIASPTVLYKSALDKLGIEMEVFKVGTYKAAVEPYLLDHISEPNREQISAYIGGLWNSITSGISTARKISVDSLQAFVNRGGAFGEAKQFVDFGLVDTLVYRTDVPDLVAEMADVEEAGDLHMVGLSDLYSYLQGQASNNNSSNRIAVVFAEGEITEVSSNPYTSSETTIGYSLAEDIRGYADDDDVKAVILRINSPGGSAFLSEQIWREVSRLRETKPVIVSMGDVAASGGYYIASGASKIVAEPNTLTGSIGIFGLMPNASGLSKKIGLNLDVVKTSEFANLDLGLPLNPMTPEEKALIQRQVEHGYDIFLSRVAEGRGMSKAQVDSIAQGRVWLGKKAKELGLVDELGGLDTAIKVAAREAKLGNDYYVDYGSTSISTLDQLFGTSSSDNFVARIRSMFMTKEEKAILRLMNSSPIKFGLQTRLPYEYHSY